jgi:tRNA threonylcarbamoyl adenosine modification protein YeaZ
MIPTHAYGFPMPEITLAIDASTADVSVAILQDDEVVARHARPATKGESGNLLIDIKQLCNQAAVGLDHITCYAVGLGPGNFTGLRLSAAAVQALALPFQTPVVGICSAEAIAHAIREEHGDHPITVVGDARRERVWLITYDGIPHPRPTPTVWPLAEVASALTARQSWMATPDWSRIGNQLEAIVPASVNLMTGDCRPDAGIIGKLAWHRHQENADLVPIDPIYVHPPVFIEPVFHQKS